MNDPNKKTMKFAGLEKKAMDELAKNAPTNKVLEEVSTMKDVLQYTAARFNALREQLANCCTLINNTDSEALKYAILARAVSKGDYGILLDEEREEFPTNTVEEASLFAKCLLDIKNTKRYDTRMNACISVHGLIVEAIARWRSKIEKMKSLSQSTDNGAAESELDTASKRIMQFEKAVMILKERDALIAEVYLSTKKQLIGFIKKSDIEFYKKEV